jgi:Kef-type K+ transport system membrane component KefB
MVLNVILSIGILIFTGFVLGELAEKVKLPKISGYIIAGILLNPDLMGIMSDQFVDHTDPLLEISLSFITFTIGGTLSSAKLIATGKKVLVLTVSESLFTFIVVFLLMFLSFNFFIHLFNSVEVVIAISLVLASLAVPTDPSATLAIIHEYKARGNVSSTMLGIAAFDDIMAIIIYTLVTAFATLLLGNTGVELSHILLNLGTDIGGAVAIGCVIGFLFNIIIKIAPKQSEGTLIVLTFGLLLLCYGISEYLKLEALLSTMTLGVIVVNLNPLSGKIFKIIERYTDEMIFLIFFTLSGLHLQLSSITGSFVVILIYIIARMIGKFSGIYTGSVLMKTAPKIKKYTAGGLIPQGGIVIGLALLLTKDPLFEDTASLIIGIVIGAVLIHEVIGPLFSRFFLKKAGEIK